MTNSTVTRVQIPLRIPPDISTALDLAVIDSPLSRNAWIEEAITQRLANEQAKVTRLDEHEARIDALEKSLILVEHLSKPTEIPGAIAKAVCPGIVSFTQAAVELKRRGKPTCRKRLKKRLVKAHGETPTELFELGLRVDRELFDQGADQWLYFVEIGGDR